VRDTGYKTEGGCDIFRLGSGWNHDQNRSWRSPGFEQSDRHPVVCISWNDAEAFVAWLSNSTKTSYRLLSEAEREYVTRAGTTTPFWWGSSISTAQANYDGNYTYVDGSAGGWRKATVAVDSFRPNPWGLYNVHGNVWEWVKDCSHRSYQGAPTDGSAWTAGDCDRRILRGGSWQNAPRSLRAADRNAEPAGLRGDSLSLRVARSLSP
jgi:formylglycine-generating enzyme required for sulfatase activity